MISLLICLGTGVKRILTTEFKYSKGKKNKGMVFYSTEQVLPSSPDFPTISCTMGLHITGDWVWGLASYMFMYLIEV